jgi:hypothetical protein
MPAPGRATGRAGGKVHAGFARAWLGTGPEPALAAQVAHAGWRTCAVPPGSSRYRPQPGRRAGDVCCAAGARAGRAGHASARPGSANADFAARFAGRQARRHVDCCDVIARIPPEPLYAHVGALHYCDRHGRLLAAPGDAAIAADRRAGAFDYLARHAWRPGNVVLRGLADHAPVNYVSALLGLREG